jgi:cytochrome c
VTAALPGGPVQTFARLALAVGFLGTMMVDVAAATEPKSGEDEIEVPEAAEVCLSCHAYEKDEAPLEGPTLWGVVGRPVASMPGFDYSQALRNVHATWDRALLDRFLTNPQAFAPGTRMDMGGVHSAKDREAVLDFLEKLRSQ